MPNNQILGALLTVSGLLNMYTNFYPQWTKNDWAMSQRPYAHNIYGDQILNFSRQIL